MRRILGVLFAGVLGAGAAQAQGRAAAEGGMRDPWVPPAVQEAARGMPKAKVGSDLEAEVERKLRADFMAAAPGGELTRGAAQAAGLGFIARHFDAIDRRGSGVVRFEDYRAFLRDRGAGFLK